MPTAKRRRSAPSDEEIAITRKLVEMFDAEGHVSLWAEIKRRRIYRRLLRDWEEIAAQERARGDR